MGKCLMHLILHQKVELYLLSADKFSSQEEKREGNAHNFNFVYLLLPTVRAQQAKHSQPFEPAVIYLSINTKVKEKETWLWFISHSHSSTVPYWTILNSMSRLIWGQRIDLKKDVVDVSHIQLSGTRCYPRSILDCCYNQTLPWVDNEEIPSLKLMRTGEKNRNSEERTDILYLSI